MKRLPTGTRPPTRAHGASRATRCASSIRKNAQRSIRLKGRNTPRGPERLRWNSAFDFRHQAA
ncbi:hypothetical protein RHECNPAF_4310063 [Rhizobium etli CNPAF512]|nr:hypothetical protein RHECNPAF_4310063 [Rhizobium etli CNPAF512]